jgi:hypothetical protein
MDEREILLGELMAEVLAALDERRFDAVDPILERAGEDRQQVLDMVELALALRGPAAPSEAVVREIADSPMFDERSWPEILEPARHALGLKRPELIDRLAARLGIADAPGRARLGERYHELEAGLIPARGAAPALVAALGDLLGGIADTLAQTRYNGAAGPGPAVAFNRTGAPLELAADLAMAPPDETTDSERLVDDLFGV